MSFRLSLIILNWNGSTHLERCLNSIKDHIAGDNEVIVVDNASVDDSLEMVRRIYPAAQIMALPSNGGFCRPNNLAAHSASGDYLVFLNNDIVVGPGFFEQLYDAIRLHSPDLLAVRMLQLRNPELIDNCGIYFSFYGAGRQRFRGFKADYNEAMDVASGITPSGACFVIRRQLFLELGGFDETLVFNHEDVDLGLKAIERNLRCVYTPFPIVFHYGSASADLVSEKSYYYIQRNNEIVFGRHLGRRFWCIVPHFAYEVFQFIKAVRGSRAKLFFRSKCDGIRALLS